MILSAVRHRTCMILTMLHQDHDYELCSRIFPEHQAKAHHREAYPDTDSGRGSQAALPHQMVFLNRSQNLLPLFAAVDVSSSVVIVYISKQSTWHVPNVVPIRIFPAMLSHSDLFNS